MTAQPSGPATVTQMAGYRRRRIRDFSVLIEDPEVWWWLAAHAGALTHGQDDSDPAVDAIADLAAVAAVIGDLLAGDPPTVGPSRACRRDLTALRDREWSWEEMTAANTERTKHGRGRRGPLTDEEYAAAMAYSRAVWQRRKAAKAAAAGG